MILVDATLTEKFDGVLSQLPHGVRLLRTDIDNGPEWPVAASAATEPAPLSGDDDAILTAREAALQAQKETESALEKAYAAVSARDPKIKLDFL